MVDRSLRDGGSGDDARIDSMGEMNEISPARELVLGPLKPGTGAGEMDAEESKQG